MAAIVVKAFNGLKPISHPILLDTGDAQTAQNVLLNSGSLRPLNALTTLKALHKVAPKTIYRYDPNNDQPEDSYWLEFANDTDVMRSPIAQDQWDRLYWTDYPNGPKYAPMTMVISPSGDGSLPGASYLLGVPKPTSKPAVSSFTAPAGTDTVEHSYVVTYFNTITQKEGAPGPAFTCNSVPGESVKITGLPTNAQGDVGTTKKRLYRKVPDTSPATTKTYRRITEIPLEQTSYEDKTSDAAAVVLPPLPAAFSSTLVATKVAPVASVEDLPAAAIPISRKYSYVLNYITYGGTVYVYSAPSPEVEVMLDVTQTATISGFVNSNSGISYTVNRRDNPVPTTQYLTLRAWSDLSVDDPVGLSQLGGPFNPGPAPAITAPPAPTVTFTPSKVSGLQTRLYMLTYLDSSNAESLKGPSSTLVKVIDGVTGVTLKHTETVPTGAVKKRLYRQTVSVDGGGNIIADDNNWRMVQENTAVTTSFYDKIIDSALPGVAYNPAFVNIPPTPPAGGVATAVAAETATTETRVYCYTYITAYDEEGPPSDASDVATVDPAKDVVVDLPGGPPSGNYNITKKRIYRSATGSARTKFQFVGEVPVASTSFTDNVKTSALGELLPSEGWIPPPVGLRGLRLMANGAAVGFAGNSLYFSEPNLPHAWPHEYPIDDEIIAIGTFGQSVAVLTNNFPYLFTGVDPQAMASQKLLLPQSCTNKRSVVETGDGVLYASPDGMTMIGQGASVMSQGVLSRAQWQSYNPTSMEAFVHNGRVLVTYDNGQRGLLVIDVSGSGAMFTTSDVNAVNGFAGGHYSPQRDKLYFVQGSNIVRWDDGGPLLAQWRSKLFRLPQHDNFGFAQILCKTYAPYPEFRLYADGVLKFFKVVMGPDQFRLPAGFKSLDWEFQVDVSVEVTEVFIASSSAELQAA
jgi:hypothetical protein